MFKMKINELTLKERIDRAINREGRKQSWITEEMKNHDIFLSEPLFSRKKNGFEKFSQEELKALSMILNEDFANNEKLSVV